jgi:ankyrin repeat protein
MTGGSGAINAPVDDGAAVPTGDKDFEILEAACMKRYGVLQQLVEAGVKLGPQDETVSGNYLITAVLNKNFDILRNLIKLGMNVDAKNEDGHTALMHAAQSGNMRLVKLLVENGAKIDMKDDNEENAIQWAEYNAHPEIAKFLEKTLETQEAQRRTDVR